MIRHSQLSSGAALAALLALGACGRSGGGANVAMEPGEWETTVQLTNVDVSNLPPEMRGDLARMPANRTETTRGCWVMSADVVRIENLRLNVPTPGTAGAQCNFPEMLMEGGTLRGRMSCSGLPGPRMAGRYDTMSLSGELDGSYTASSVQATAHAEIRFGAQSGSGRVRITSRRLGACPPPRPYTPPVMSPDSMDMNMAVPVPPVPMPPPPVSGEPARNALRTDDR